MCFYKKYYVNNRIVEATKQKAKTDIVCYKQLLVIDGKILSPFKDFQYKTGKKYRIWFWRFKDKKYKEPDNINVGYHSYQEHHFGSHMYSRKGQIVASDTFKCIIPKGSYYFKNEKEYVSNQIIIKEQISS